MSADAVPNPQTVGHSCSQIERHVRAAERRGLRPTTLAARRSILTRLALQHGPLETMTAATLTAWWDSHQSAPASRNVDLSHVKAWFRWAQRDGLRADDPTVNLDRVRTQRRLPRPITEAEMERAIALADGRVACWLTLAGFAGLRACEIAGLRGEDVDLSRNVLFVADGKGGKQRCVPMHLRVAAILEDAPTRGPVWHTRDGSPVTANLVSVVCNGHLRACQVRATLHQFRHRFGTQIYANSHDLRVTQELLGHSSPTTTAGYVAWSETAAAAAVAGL